MTDLSSYLTGNESFERMKTVLNHMEAHEESKLKGSCFQFGKFIFSKHVDNKDTIDEWKKKMLAHFTLKRVDPTDANMSGAVWKFNAQIQIDSKSEVKELPFDMTVAQLSDELELESGFEHSFAYNLTLAKELVWKVLPPLKFTTK